MLLKVGLGLMLGSTVSLFGGFWLSDGARSLALIFQFSELMLLVGFAFIGLDAVGTQIEDPFGTDPNDLPLSAISRNIEIDLLQQLGETEVPPVLRPQDGLLL